MSAWLSKWKNTSHQATKGMKRDWPRQSISVESLFRNFTSFWIPSSLVDDFIWVAFNLLDNSVHLASSRVFSRIHWSRAIASFSIEANSYTAVSDSICWHRADIISSLCSSSVKWECGIDYLLPLRKQVTRSTRSLYVENNHRHYLMNELPAIRLILFKGVWYQSYPFWENYRQHQPNDYLQWIPTDKTELSLYESGLI